jgi:outer membrane lipoprotein-sorting protein
MVRAGGIGARNAPGVPFVSSWMEDRIMSRRLWFTALVLTGVAAAGTPAQPRAQAATADDIVARYVQAIGGADALGKVTSRRATGTATVSTPGGDVSGPIEVLSKAPNKTRVSITLDLSAMGAGSVDIVQRFDGTSGMMSNSMQGDVEIAGAQLENMRNGLFPTPFLHYKENGTTLTLLPKDTIDGKAVLVVQAKPKAGPVVTVYFDPDTFLVVRTMVRVNSPQLGGDVDQYQDPSDYRDVSGVKVPFRIVNSTAGQTVTIVFSKVENNVPIEDSVFGK